MREWAWMLRSAASVAVATAVMMGATTPVVAQTEATAESAPSTEPVTAAEPEVSPESVATPAAEPAPAPVVESAPAPVQKAESSKLSRFNPRRSDIVFGSYRVRLMYARPTFRDQIKHYDSLYGKAKDYPQIGMDWFAWDWFATMGVGLRFGYYSDDGNAALVSNSQASDLGGLSAADVSRDQNGPTTLLLIPLQALFTMEITPFPKKWLVIDGWAGWERLYFQETRNQKQAATSTTGTTTTTTSTGTSTTTTGGTTTSTRLTGLRGGMTPMPPDLSAVTVSNDRTLTNTGWRNAIVVGAAANILLNALDEESSASLRNIGIGGVYLSPFMEWIRTVGQPAGSTFTFGRNVIGLAFTFETVK
ncbi:MAG: hypothetical protein FJ146_14965 [Deltaproteobacteria bacterium]|nr:hypothetical protein [Deltaproteobacteria bacterium]